VPLVLVADLFNNFSVFRLITGGIEGADKNVRFRMAEVIEFYVQPGFFNRRLSGQECFSALQSLPRLAGRCSISSTGRLTWSLRVFASRVSLTATPRFLPE